MAKTKAGSTTNASDRLLLNEAITDARILAMRLKQEHGSFDGRYLNAVGILEGLEQASELLFPIITVQCKDWDRLSIAERDALVNVVRAARRAAREGTLQDEAKGA